MRILLAASEMVGFAKTGGLADVVGSLPVALARRGHQPAVILPLYHVSIRPQPHGQEKPLRPTGKTLRIPLGNRTIEGALLQTVLPGTDIPVFLVEQPAYFERDNQPGHGLYQFTEYGQVRDYGDNAERFMFFCRAILEALPLLDFWPDVLHLNDWQTGLVPVYLREVYARHKDAELQAKYQKVRTLFTIHNIGYQGNFSPWEMRLTGLDWKLFNPDQLEFHGRLSFLKAGLVFADALSTVSPTYAREIQTPAYGCGMQGILTARREQLFGIVNGIDTTTWDPAADPFLPAHYTAEAIGRGKAICKQALQERFALPAQPDTPVLGVVARLAEQKGIDLIVQAAQHFLRQEVQLVVLGDGQPRYQQMLQELHTLFPTKVGLLLGFDEPLAHLIEAGSDLFLMPSLYEPSGLNQLYSVRYGTPPVVRTTGGLADTIVDATAKNLEDGTATGFCFGPYEVVSFLEAIQRGIDLYQTRTQSPTWNALLACAMRQVWSWDRSAEQYAAVYQNSVQCSVFSVQ